MREPWRRAVRDGYDQVAPHYAETFPDTSAENALDLAMVDAFAAAVASTDGRRVLDAGCGSGRMSRYLGERGCVVEGMDLSPGMLALARRDSPDLSCVLGSVTELPYGAGTFDGVLLWYSLIHVPPPALPRALAEPARVLRPGGAVLVGVQSGEGTRNVAWSYLDAGREHRLERHRYTAEVIAGQLSAVGLSEVARLERRAEVHERDDQASVLARALTGG